MIIGDLSMNIYTTYFANIRHLPESIIPVSIAGKPPEKWDGIEYKKLAPKWSFFSEWKKTKNNDYYIEHFYNEVLSSLTPQNVIDELNKISSNNDNKDIALVCYEIPRDFCHRHIVSGWLNRNGYCVKEYIDMNSIKDTDDGITHINIYSKGKTDLGKMLSNFYNFPIHTDDGDFLSVEGYWYWLSIDDSVREKEELRCLYGFNAKSRGKEILKETNDGKSSRFEPDFENKILKAIWYKFRRNANLLTPEYRRLPIVHYYCYGGKVVDVTSKYQWLIDGITKMRDYL